MSARRKHHQDVALETRRGGDIQGPCGRFVLLFRIACRPRAVAICEFRRGPFSCPGGSISVPILVPDSGTKMGPRRLKSRGQKSQGCVGGVAKSQHSRRPLAQILAQEWSQILGSESVRFWTPLSRFLAPLGTDSRPRLVAESGTRHGPLLYPAFRHFGFRQIWAVPSKPCRPLLAAAALSTQIAVNQALLA